MGPVCDCVRSTCRVYLPKDAQTALPSEHTLANYEQNNEHHHKHHVASTTLNISMCTGKHTHTTGAAVGEAPCDAAVRAGGLCLSDVVAAAAAVVEAGGCAGGGAGDVDEEGAKDTGFEGKVGRMSSIFCVVGMPKYCATSNREG